MGGSKPTGRHRRVPPKSHALARSAAIAGVVTTVVVSGVLGTTIVRHPATDPGRLPTLSMTTTARITSLDPGDSPTSAISVSAVATGTTWSGGWPSDGTAGIGDTAPAGTPRPTGRAGIIITPEDRGAPPSPSCVAGSAGPSGATDGTAATTTVETAPAVSACPASGSGGAANQVPLTPTSTTPPTQATQ